jgi:hypothetical protein
MLLVVAGDSNSFGSESLRDYDYTNAYNPYYAYGGWLSRAHSWEYKNIARAGSSNIDIAESVFKFINEGIPDLNETVFIIGWTEAGRLNIGKREEKGPILTPAICKSYFFDSPLPDSVQTSAETLKKIDPTKEFSRIYLERISVNNQGILNNFFIRLLVDLYLTKINAKYFTFPTLPSILSAYNIQFKHLLSSKNNIIENNSIEILNKKYSSFNFLDVFEEYGKSAGNHLKASAHRQIARWLYGELLSREVI